MRKDELLLFTQYDSNPNAPARFCFHSSFIDPTVPDHAPPRESVEIRAIAFFPTEYDAMAGMNSTLAMLQPDNAEYLTRALAQGASHGYLDPSEIDDIVDAAAYSGADNEEVIAAICVRRGVGYSPYEWTPGSAAENVLSMLKALQSSSAPLQVNGNLFTKTIKALQTMLARAGNVEFFPWMATLLSPHSRQ